MGSMSQAPPLQGSQIDLKRRSICCCYVLWYAERLFFKGKKVFVHSFVFTVGCKKGTISWEMGILLVRNAVMCLKSGSEYNGVLLVGLTKTVSKFNTFLWQRVKQGSNKNKTFAILYYIMPQVRQTLATSLINKGLPRWGWLINVKITHLKCNVNLQLQLQLINYLYEIEYY